MTEFEEVRRSRVDLIYEDEAEIDEPTAPAARILMAAQGDTHCGRFRARNEDSLLMLREHSVFVVADGMGGHEGGGVASELAVKRWTMSIHGELFRAWSSRRDLSSPRARSGARDPIGQSSSVLARGQHARARRNGHHPGRRPLFAEENSASTSATSVIAAAIESARARCVN